MFQITALKSSSISSDDTLRDPLCEFPFTYKNRIHTTQCVRDQLANDTKAWCHNGIPGQNKSICKEGYPTFYVGKCPFLLHSLFVSGLSIPMKIIIYTFVPSCFQSVRLVLACTWTRWQFTRCPHCKTAAQMAPLGQRVTRRHKQTKSDLYTSKSSITKEN